MIKWSDRLRSNSSHRNTLQCADEHHFLRKVTIKPLQNQIQLPLRTQQLFYVFYYWVLSIYLLIPESFQCFPGMPCPHRGQKAETSGISTSQSENWDSPPKPTAPLHPVDGHPLLQMSVKHQLCCFPSPLVGIAGLPDPYFIAISCSSLA